MQYAAAKEYGMTSSANEMTGAQQLCEELNRHGVRDVFGLMGDGNVQWIPLLAKYGIKYHSSRHEAGAIAMADAYSRATGRVGVCTVTHGPGLTHGLSCLIEANRARSSVLFILGETPSRNTAYSCQDLNHEGVLDSVGCAHVDIPVVGVTARVMARAFARIQTEQRPITVLFPTDIQSQRSRYAPITLVTSSRCQEADPADIGKLADLVEASKRPLIIAGRGAARAGAGEVLEAIAARIGALVGTTVLSKGLFSGNPYSVDIMGGFSTRVATNRIREADLVLAFGTSFSTWTSRAGSLIAPQTKIVQVVDEADALGRHAPLDLGILADAKATADALEAELGRRKYKSKGVRTPELAKELKEGRLELRNDATTEGLIDPRVAILKLDEMLPAQRTLAVDGGWNQPLPVRLLNCPDAHGLVFLQTYQALGPGVAAAIGAAIGRPDRMTALVLGDGALAMSMGELETATRLKLPIVIVVLNDDAYHAEVQGLNDIGQPTDAAYFGDVDFGAVARALGGQGATIRSVEDLEKSLSGWLADPRGPIVLDCKIPCPIDYWGDSEQKWLEDFWHEPRRTN